MKEQLYTIPVNEAIDKNEECLFCTLNKKVEEDILNYILGPSYMEEDIRSETDKIGFCKKHYSQMYKAQNRLGVALILSTHMKNIRQNLNEIFKDELNETNHTIKKNLFRKNEEQTKSVEYISEIENSCYACKRMESRMNSYIDTFFYLWKKEDDFREKILNSKGFCLEHFNMLIKEGKKKLSSDKYKDFLTVLVPLELKNLDLLQEDIDWFIQKFDYRFKDEPWKNSKDALQRTILKVSSENVEE